MAGDWFKVEMTLPDKPEVCQLADSLDIDIDTVVGKLIRFWRWCNYQSVDGANLGVTISFIDRLTNCPGFSAGLIKVGWLINRKGRLSVPNFDRHNGQSAKSRALTADRVKRHRDDPCNGDSVTEELPEKRRREETRGDPNRLSKGDRNTIGTNGNNGHSFGSSHSPLEIDPERKAEETPLDLSGVDWDHVLSMADSVSRKIRPKSENDRRAWLRYAVLADMTFGEHWLMDSLEAVLHSSRSNKGQRAHFVGVLKSKALKEVDEGTFASMFRRIEIPNDIWHSKAVSV